MVLILHANPYPVAWTDEVKLVGVEVSSPNLPFSPRRTCGYGTLGMAELVLVVEDEAHVRELVSYTLQGAGLGAALGLPFISRCVWRPGARGAQLRARANA